MREPDTEVIDKFLGMSSRANGPACNFVSNSCSQTEALCFQWSAAAITADAQTVAAPAYLKVAGMGKIGDIAD